MTMMVAPPPPMNGTSTNRSKVTTATATTTYEQQQQTQQQQQQQPHPPQPPYPYPTAPRSSSSTSASSSPATTKTMEDKKNDHHDDAKKNVVDAGNNGSTTAAGRGGSGYGYGSSGSGSDNNNNHNNNDQSAWRRPGKHFRCRLLSKDRDTFSLNHSCGIEKYYEVADRVLDQFLQHPIDTREDLVEAYLIGSRLSNFLSLILPTHPEYFSCRNNAAHLILARHNSQKQVVDLLSYIEQIAILIDRQEHELYISKVLLNNATANDSSHGTASTNTSTSLSGSGSSSSGLHQQGAGEDSFETMNNTTITTSNSSTTRIPQRYERNTNSSRRLPPRVPNSSKPPLSPQKHHHSSASSTPTTSNRTCSSPSPSASPTNPSPPPSPLYYQNYLGTMPTATTSGSYTSHLVDEDDYIRDNIEEELQEQDDQGHPLPVMSSSSSSLSNFLQSQLPPPPRFTTADTDGDDDWDSAWITQSQQQRRTTARSAGNHSVGGGSTTTPATSSSSTWKSHSLSLASSSQEYDSDNESSYHGGDDNSHNNGREQQQQEEDKNKGNGNGNRHNYHYSRPEVQEMRSNSLVDQLAMADEDPAVYNTTLDGGSHQQQQEALFPPPPQQRNNSNNSRSNSHHLPSSLGAVHDDVLDGNHSAWGRPIRQKKQNSSKKSQKQQKQQQYYEKLSSSESFPEARQHLGDNNSGPFSSSNSVPRQQPRSREEQPQGAAGKKSSHSPAPPSHRQQYAQFHPYQHDEEDHLLEPSHYQPDLGQYSGWESPSTTANDASHHNSREVERQFVVEEASRSIYSKSPSSASTRPIRNNASTSQAQQQSHLPPPLHAPTARWAGGQQGASNTNNSRNTAFNEQVDQILVRESMKYSQNQDNRHWLSPITTSSESSSYLSVQDAPKEGIAPSSYLTYPQGQEEGVSRDVFVIEEEKKDEYYEDSPPHSNGYVGVPKSRIDNADIFDPFYSSVLETNNSADAPPPAQQQQRRQQQPTVTRLDLIRKKPAAAPLDADPTLYAAEDHVASGGSIMPKLQPSRRDYLPSSRQHQQQRKNGGDLPSSSPLQPKKNYYWDYEATTMNPAMAGIQQQQQQRRHRPHGSTSSPNSVVHGNQDPPNPTVGSAALGFTTLIEERWAAAANRKTIGSSGSSSTRNSPTSTAVEYDGEEIDEAMVNAFFVVKKRRPLSHFRDCVRCLVE